MLVGTEGPYRGNDCGAEVGATGNWGRDGCGGWAWYSGCGGEAEAVVLCRERKEFVER